VQATGVGGFASKDMCFSWVRWQGLGLSWARRADVVPWCRVVWYWISVVVVDWWWGWWFPSLTESPPGFEAEGSDNVTDSAASSASKV
jgi:hypothetical protein